MVAKADEKGHPKNTAWLASYLSISIGDLQKIA